jgi:hypothetical protein
MDFSKVEYSTLIAAHAGFKGGQDKDRSDRDVIIKAMEREIVKRRAGAVETILNIVDGKQPAFTSPFEVAVPRNTVIPPRTTDLDAAMKAYGIPSKYNAQGDELTSYNPSRPKYPFSYTGRKGGRWKASIMQAKERFG